MEKIAPEAFAMMTVPAFAMAEPPLAIKVPELIVVTPV
jgi:hypothetical protein